MGNEKNYYLGLDIGTDSVGYAVADEKYNLIRFHGEPAWGSTIFEAGNLSDSRRGFRSARRRLDRRQERVKLVQEIFAREIAKVDERFFIRLQESFRWRDETDDRYIFFDDENYTDVEYNREYPTIHHLIHDLMYGNEPKDVRLVYLACAWLVAHRGHFLSNLDVEHLDSIGDVKNVYEGFCSHFIDRGYRKPFEDVDEVKVGDVLKEKCGVNVKREKLTAVLLGGKKASKEISEDLPYSVDAMIRLLAGGTVKLKDFFGKEEYDELEVSSLTLGMEDEKYVVLAANLGDDYDIIECLRALYDWSILVETLGNARTISDAKIAVYNQHKKDLTTLKYFVRKYAPKKYDAIFRDARLDNYVAYSYHTDGLSEKERVEVKRKASSEDFCKFVKSIVKEINVEAQDQAAYDDMMERLELLTFLPKQKNTDNRVIPHQLYLYELKAILEKASGYLPFLKEMDDDGLSNEDKILSIFTYKLPYFVGPLNGHSEHAWVKRRIEGRILPWNYEQMIDFDASEQAFINRMTNSCSYLGGETVLPKDSLCYQKFMVLNEINNLRIGNERIPVEVKQGIYHDLFEKKKKVTRKQIEEYLISCHVIEKDEREFIGGIDVEIKSNLSSYCAFHGLLDRGVLKEDDVEKIIERASYAEDKSRMVKWLRKNYQQLSEDDCRYISNIKIKDFGRLSRAFLAGVEGLVDQSTGELMTILGAMWETNYNLMELLSDRFGFAEEIRLQNEAYYGKNQMKLENRMDEMYLSNAVRRSIYRTLDIVSDVNRAFGAPKKIFIEMTRGEDASKKGKRTSSRRQQIDDLYKKCKNEDVRELKHQMEAMGERLDSRLQSDRLFLYFMQFGRCAYSGTAIDLDRLMNSGAKEYDIDHIYPQAFVKDDSIINNKVLVLSAINGAKKDVYPLSSNIREKMSEVWSHWKRVGTISEEKYKRLTRNVPFTEEERYGFINRQLTETSQSTKAVATLLKEKFPDVEIVYTKAGLTSDFRQKYNLLKSRNYNDLHHAVDAYLNIVTGNVYNGMFSKKFFKLPEDNNYSIKTETIFKYPRYCGKECIWDGEEMLQKVIRTAQKNNAHFSKYAFLRHGGFFDQMPVKRSEGLVSRKNGLSTEKYGGYNKPTVMFFLPVRYRAGKKSDVIIMPVELLYGERVLSDAKYAEEYAYERLERILGKKMDEISFPLGLRPWKINTMLSMEGFRVCVKGNANGGKTLIAEPVMQFSAGEKWKIYVKRLERFVEKSSQRNNHIIYDAEHDKVTEEENLQLYDIFIDKLENSIYGKRPNAPLQTLKDGREKFIACSMQEQCSVLLNILTVFGRMSGGCDLTLIGGKPKEAATSGLSSAMTNWKKNYKDVRIVDQSATGLWEEQSENILDFL